MRCSWCSRFVKRGQGGEKRYVESKELLGSAACSCQAIGQTLALTSNGRDPDIEVKPLAVVKDLFEHLHEVDARILFLFLAHSIDLLPEGSHQRFGLLNSQGLRWLAQEFIVTRKMAAQFCHVVLDGRFPGELVMFTDHR